MLAVTIVDWTTNTQLEHIYDRLLDRDAKTLRPKPMLATGWKVVNDTTWEFTLRQGVKFHNGEPFDAHSVKATMDYLKDPNNKSHFAAYWKLIKDVQIVNDFTVRFVTEKPWPSLIDRASLTDFLVMPAKALKDLGPDKLAQKPIGTGPFRFVEWRRDDRLVLEAIRLLGRPGRGEPGDFSAYSPSSAGAWPRLLSGEIDIMKDVPPHALEAVERCGRAKIRSAVSSRINYLALVNLKPGPMQDVRVRRAMNHAVDVDELIAQVLRGHATRICGVSRRPTSTSPRWTATTTTPRAPRPSSRRRESIRPSSSSPSTPRRGAIPRQGRLARHRRPAPAARHQDQCGGQ